MQTCIKGIYAFSEKVERGWDQNMYIFAGNSAFCYTKMSAFLVKIPYLSEIMNISQYRVKAEQDVLKQESYKV